ncbi:hypothetical protein Efla_003946 [Eimeria flavescens]
MEHSAVEESCPPASEAPPSGALKGEPPCGGETQMQNRGASGRGALQPAASDQTSCDDFNMMWNELESYLTKRFVECPQRLLSLSRAVEQFKLQRLRVEELAFLIGYSFPDAPDVSLCMSLFLPDRTLIHAGNPAAAMCSLIQNMAPDKYAIFNSILKSCMAQKTQRGSRDILLHRMQLLFRGHPLVIRAIRKLLVQQFCVEKNNGTIRKDQAVELTKPMDDEPLQVHSAFRLAYQVGVSGECLERAKVIASNVLHLIRMFRSERLPFSAFSHELDRLFARYSSWSHVSDDIKRLVLSISEDDVRTAKELARVVKLLAARNSEACEDRRSCLNYLCDLFLNGVANKSVALRIEVDHLLSRGRQGSISPSFALQRVASLLAGYPDCCEQLGVLMRLFRDLARREAQTREAASSEKNTQDDACRKVINFNISQSVDPAVAPEAREVGVELGLCGVGRRAEGGSQLAKKENASLEASKNKGVSAEVKALAGKAAELLCRHVAPCRFRSQELMIQLMGYPWIDEAVYNILDEWNAGRLSRAQVVAALEASGSRSPNAEEVLRLLIAVFEARGGAGPPRAALTRQQYDALPRNGSYRKLPDEWPASECSGRDALAWQVLNDRWALFPDSSESQARYMNSHEEALLSLADCRYEWDLRIGRLASCLRKLEAVGEALMKLPETERNNCTVRPSYFKQIHIASFRRIFGTNTEQVLSCLCAAPLASLETIYSTLEFKLMQWKAMREVLNAYWASQEQPHYAGAIDFKKRFVGEKRGGVDADELRAAEGRDGRTKAPRVLKGDPA